MFARCQLRHSQRLNNQKSYDNVAVMTWQLTNGDSNSRQLVVDKYDEKLTQNVVLFFWGHGVWLSCIGTYRNVSGCIGDRFSSRKSQARHVPIHSDTSRYVPIRPDFFTQFFTQPFEIPLISHGCQELSHRHKVAVQVRHGFNCQPTKTKLQASQRYQWQVFQNRLEQFEDVHRSLWMKIVPYVYVNVQFHAWLVKRMWIQWWLLSTARLPTYRASRKPLQRAKVASNHPKKNDLNLQNLKTDVKMSSKIVLEILKKSPNLLKMIWKTAKNKFKNS